MNFTFGICVSKDTPHDRLFNQLVSIVNASQYMKYIEVIIAGDMNPDAFKVVEGFSSNLSIKYLPYEGPSDKPGHITKKKNDIADIAFFDNICLMHDYYNIPLDFAEAIPKTPWDITVLPIVTREGARHSDWLVNPAHMQKYIDSVPGVADELMAVAPHENNPKYVCGLPYHVKYMTPIQYISGGFIVCKTEVMRDNPFDEKMYWGDAEDLDWSARVVPKYRLITTAWNNSTRPVRVTKSNKWAVSEIPAHIIQGLKSYYGL